ncbi:hypothetical protein DVH05_017716 [Phytophthora capsici]|nr:hypothetical protein DVH05_017716 [Phytophthora capsici]
MAARRETRSEGEAFRARLVNRSEAERQRLLKDHQEYLAGERDEDADFGDCSSSPTPATTVADTDAAASSESARTPVSSWRPPMGKTAAYLAC